MRVVGVVLRAGSASLLIHPSPLVFSRCASYTYGMYDTTTADVMLKLVQRDGYSVGETLVCHPLVGDLYAHIDAAKDGHRWIVTAPTRFEAATILMEQLGWDLMDG